MKSARNQLILLGFLCQGLSWDGYYLALISALLWALCLTLPRHPVRLSPVVECLLVAAGCAFGYFAGKLFQQSNHFVIGHGITLIQAARLLRPLNRREKMFSVIAACMQIAVGCTIILDIRFVGILVAAIILIPRAFLEIEVEGFDDSPLNRKLSFNPVLYVVIITGSLLFFTVFPRSVLSPEFQNRAGGSDSTASLLDTVIDPTSGGNSQSSKVLLQIDGPSLSYLRVFTLDEYDGQLWKADPRTTLRLMELVPLSERSRYLVRHVRVKDVAFLGRILPTDGKVVGLDGHFFRRPLLSSQNVIECLTMWNTGDNAYDYWMNPQPNSQPLLERRAEQLVSYPPQTLRLRKWLDMQLAGVSDPLEQARKLEAYFRGNFIYRLGAPKLSRLNTADDFIFNQREGHCERFATTLALLLRMQNIPSRVVVGYVPTQRNAISGWYNIRFKDAHAWTEAWFPNRGWVQFDATPRGTYQPTIVSLSDWFEMLDSAWNIYVVNFDTPTQRELFSNSVSLMGMGMQWVKTNAWIGFAVMFAILFAVAWRKMKTGKPKTSDAKTARLQTQKIAEHYYGRMLRDLARKGFHRLPQQTPYEFLQHLQQTAFAFTAEAKLITEFFCATRYGNASASLAQQSTIEQALKRIQQQAKGNKRRA